MHARLFRLLPAVVAVLCLSLAGAARGGGSTLYVDGASIGGPCSDTGTSDDAQNPATPWCSVSKALNVAPDGSSVQVRTRTYAAASASGRHLALGISVSPFPGDSPVLTSVTLTQSDRFTFTGLALGGVQVDNALSDTFTYNDFTGGGLFATAASGLVVGGNVFHDVGDGLMLRRSAYVSVTGNVFRDLPHRTDAEGDGIQGSDLTRLTVRGNTFLRISNPLGHSDSIELVSANDYVTIDGNLFRSARGIIIVGGTGGAGKLTGHLAITNNEMTQTPGWAVTIANAPDATLADNTVWAAGHGIVLRGTRTRISLYNNVVSRLEAATRTVAADDYNLIAVGPMKGAHDMRG